MLFKKTIYYLTLLFYFLLPWQTRYVWHYGELNGGYWEYGSFSLYGTQILLVMIALLFVFEVFRPGGEFVVFHVKNWSNGKRFGVMLLALFSALILEMSRVINQNLSLQWLAWVWGGMSIVIMLSESQKSIKSVKSLKSYLVAFWAGGVMQGILAVWQFFSQEVIASKWLGMAVQKGEMLGASVVEFGDERWLRAYGSFGSPNTLGIYLGVCLIIGLLLLCQYADYGEWNNKNIKILKYYNILITLGQLIILAGLVLSFSRGAWGAVIVGILFLLVIAGTLRGGIDRAGLKFSIFNFQFLNNFQFSIFKQLIYYVLLCGFLLIVLNPVFVARFDFDNRLEVKSTTERVSQYGEAWNIFKEHSLFGVGLGGYTLEKYKNNPTLKAWDYQPVHNMYMLALAEVGTIGFVLVGMIFVLFVKHIWRQNKIMLAPVLVLTVFGLFDHCLWSLYSGMVVWWGVAGLMIIIAKEEKLKLAESNH